jgi:hypothetical protein
MSHKFWTGLGLGLLMTATPALYAHEGHEKGQDISVQGEVVDMACYMGHQAMGEKHKDCAEMCVKGGMPMGLVTAQGDVYLLLEDHSSKAPYDSLKAMTAQQVKVSGDLHKRGGVQAITVEKSQKAS